MSNFQHPVKGQGTVSIGSCDDTSLTVDAQYNPKELQIDKSVPWQKKSQANKSSSDIERPSAPVNSSWIPVSLVLLVWLFFCQGTDLSICSSLGLYCAATWTSPQPSSQLAIETTSA
ncbi:MAG: hypothetical protein E6J91_30450 [Deltaproteobacteria bacterium]|nr:MAG: hypothetical protein E6J91_30450 [Deltaproteobacteria bacterium]